MGIKTITSDHPIQTPIPTYPPHLQLRYHQSRKRMSPWQTFLPTLSFPTMCFVLRAKSPCRIGIPRALLLLQLTRPTYSTYSATLSLVPCPFPFSFLFPSRPLTMYHIFSLFPTWTDCRKSESNKPHVSHIRHWVSSMITIHQRTLYTIALINSLQPHSPSASYRLSLEHHHYLVF